MAEIDWLWTFENHRLASRSRLEHWLRYFSIGCLAVRKSLLIDLPTGHRYLVYEIARTGSQLAIEAVAGAVLGALA